LLAVTGVRVSEGIGLQWRHVVLDGSTPHLKIRQGIVQGKLSPLKTRYSRREIPIGHELVVALRRRRTDSEWPGDRDHVFTTGAGTPLQVNNLRRRVLKPPAEKAAVPWAGFHTFRHTCASLLFASGRNAVQVQRWLGHHSAAFTLATYVHLLDGDIGEPLSLAIEVCLESLATEPIPIQEPGTLETW
jgi:integrase